MAAAVLLTAGGLWAAAAGHRRPPAPPAPAVGQHAAAERVPPPTAARRTPLAPPSRGASATGPVEPAPATSPAAPKEGRAAAAGSRPPLLLALALLHGRPVAASTLAVGARHLTATPLAIAGATGAGGPGPDLLQAYAGGGLKRAEAAAARAVGRPVHHGLTFDLDALPPVVDAVGGVRYNLPVPVDAGSGSSVVHLPAGDQRLNGADTLDLLELCLRHPSAAATVCGSGRLVRTLGRELMDPPPAAIPTLLLDLGPAVHSDMAVPGLIHLALAVIHAHLGLDVTAAGGG